MLRGAMRTGGTFQVAISCQHTAYSPPPPPPRGPHHAHMRPPQVGFLESQLPRALPLAPATGDGDGLLLLGWWVPEQ